MKQHCPACDESCSPGASRCHECEWIFAFKSSRETSDVEWVSLIEELSDQGRLVFTTNQLFIHWQRPRVLGLDASQARMYIALFIILASSYLPIDFNLISVSALSLVAYIPLVSKILSLTLNIRFIRSLVNIGVFSLFISSYWWFKLSLAAVIPALLLVASIVEYRWRRRKLGKQVFMQQLQRWSRYHKIPQLITTPRLHRPHRELQGDALYDYNARRVLIVDQDLTVDLLTLNGLLRDQHLLLLSINGYPEYSAQFVRRLLTIEEDVNVYLLHRDGRDPKQVMNSLRSLGVKRHRILHLGWGARNRRALIDHLGFRPREWDAFAIDSLPPESLLEGVPIALEEELALVEVLGPRLRLLA